MGRPPQRTVRAVMRALARAIDNLELPAVEKIAEESQEDPFEVLISTMLSAQTQLANAQADRIALDQQRAQLEHAIAVLVGEAPGNFTLAPIADWTATVPDVGRNKPQRIRNVVDLPAPFGPTTPQIAPDATSNDSRLTASDSPNRRVS